MLTEQEIEIIEGCRKGDAACQKRLYDTYGPLIKGTCLRYTSDMAEAEDLFHDIFVHILTHFGQYDHITNLGGWLNRITINKAIDYVRRQSINDVVPMSHFEQVQGVSNDQHYEGIPMEVLLGFIQQLPPKMRTVFNLAVIDEMDQKEIVEMLQESTNNVRTMLSRARALLRTKIQKFWKKEEDNVKKYE